MTPNFLKTACLTATLTPSSTSSIPANPNLTWWFDHHQSAFLTPEDAEHFKHDRSGTEALRPLLSFVHQCSSRRSARNDSASTHRTWRNWFAGPTSSTGRNMPPPKKPSNYAQPAMQLTLVIEGSKGSEIIHQIIRWMRHESSEAIVNKPEIQALYVPLYERHLQSIDIIRKQACCTGRCHLFRPDRRGGGRLQQIHSVLFVP